MTQNQELLEFCSFFRLVDLGYGILVMAGNQWQVAQTRTHNVIRALHIQILAATHF